MSQGTNHFAHLRAAWNYYAAYGLSESDVNEKVTRGEIALGPPTLKAGEKLSIHPTEKRYFIETK